MSCKNIYIVIPVYNRREKTLACLRCLSKQTHKDFHTVIIDDGSTDGTSQKIRKEHPNVDILKGDGNLWWTKATNIGCIYALDQGAENILTLNDDLIVKENYLQTMWEAHLQEPSAMIGSLHLSQEIPPRILFAGFISHNLFTGKSMKRCSHGETFQQQYQGLLPTIVLPGRGTLIPRKIFDSIGLFDSKRFPQYKADFEFSFRAKKAHFPLFISSESHVYTAVDSGQDINERGEQDTLSSFFLSFFKSNSTNYFLDTWRYSVLTYPTNTRFRLYLPIYFSILIMRKWGSFFKRKMKLIQACIFIASLS